MFRQTLFAFSIGLVLASCKLIVDPPNPPVPPPCNTGSAEPFSGGTTLATLENTSLPLPGLYDINQVTEMPLNGIIEETSDGQLSYVPEEGYVGGDTIVVTGSSYGCGAGQMESAISISVLAPFETASDSTISYTSTGQTVTLANGTYTLGIQGEGAEISFSFPSEAGYIPPAFLNASSSSTSADEEFTQTAGMALDFHFKPGSDASSVDTTPLQSVNVLSSPQMGLPGLQNFTFELYFEDGGYLDLNINAVLPLSPTN